MWHAVTPESLRSAVTGAERNALDNAALAPEQTDALREIAANVVAEWRGGLRRVTTLDRRPDHLPAEIMVHVLADFRYRAFTRLPGMRSLLDELRVREWERANQVRDNLAKIGIAPPDPDYAESTAESGKPRPIISNPKAGAILG